ncbi:Rv1733c family protein [Streptomyces roseochromogenus]|uniref:Uncharacterized protein n=1 Tax=Streptomyces roseochromogenus subsp. oscitans DS 12.976 TaxID=1352936 RepID=V6KYD2_STRRC|nr:hypothetical protein [Streptomyces roseochromogenus]EST36451.1 hypothetical protein M878_01845 [Streptomyces roseochromogenus subsp. oscitans DS 12.976]
MERPADRLERRLRAFLTALAVLALPLAVWAAGQATYSHYTQVRQTQPARLHPVTALLLTDARSGGDRPGAQSGFDALARWSDHNGQHAGVAPVRAWLHQGATATVWLDAHGTIAAPPEGRDFAATAGVAVGCGTALAGVAGAYTTRWAVGQYFERRRAARWTRERERFEPGWTARCRS